MTNTQIRRTKSLLSQAIQERLKGTYDLDLEFELMENYYKAIAVTQ